MGDTPRSIGFLVDDLDAAAADLRAAGVEAGPIAENKRDRYLHFRAPDHELYELVERKACLGPTNASAPTNALPGESALARERA